MEQSHNSDKSQSFHTSRGVFWLIVASLAFVLALGLPAAGYSIYKKVRMVLIEQVRQDNKAISQVFELAIREAKKRSNNEEEWLQRVQEMVEIIQVPSTGYVCLIDSNMRIKVLPHEKQMMAGQEVGKMTIFPYKPKQGSFNSDEEIPISAIFKNHEQDSFFGLRSEPDGNKLVDFHSVQIDDQSWYIGVHQYDSGIKQHLKDIFTFFVILGILLFIAIVAPFGIFTARLIGNHEHEREQYIEKIEGHLNEIETVAAKLRESNKRLNDMQEEKNRMYVRLSHDLRAPLNSVVGASAMIADEIYGEINDKQRKAIETIDRNANVLLKLIENILELSRIQSGTLTLHPEPFLLNDLLIELSENLRPFAKEKHLELRYTPKPDLTTIETDRSKLYLVLQNLVSNALQFTEEGSVEIQAQQTDSTIVLRIHDTGPGISEEEQKNIFQAFTRGASAGGQSSGVGLGLAISQELTHLLGGSIELDSTPGEGTTFTVALPASMLHKTTNAKEQEAKLT